MYKVIQGQIGNGVHIAPPLHHLKRFGGILDIMQYRANSQPRTNPVFKSYIDIAASWKPVVETSVPHPPEKIASVAKAEQANLKRAFSKITGATKTKTETLKLKRNKEITANNGNELINKTLLQHMGITIK
jgi:AraC-like DNA-binding protein